MISFTSSSHKLAIMTRKRWARLKRQRFTKSPESNDYILTEISVVLRWRREYFRFVSTHFLSRPSSTFSRCAISWSLSMFVRVEASICCRRKCVPGGCGWLFHWHLIELSIGWNDATNHHHTKKMCDVNVEATCIWQKDGCDNDASA